MADWRFTAVGPLKVTAWTAGVTIISDPLAEPFGRTVTAQLAVFAPSEVVTVIVAVPAEIGVTTPPAETVATAALLELQPTPEFVALVGLSVAVKVPVAPPAVSDRLVGLTVTPVTATVAAATVTAQLAVFAPSEVVTVIIAVPAEMPVTLPLALTVATDGLLEARATPVLVAPFGEIVHDKLEESPTARLRVFGLRLTAVTGTVTPTAQLALRLPSWVVTEIVAVPAPTAVTWPVEDTVATPGLLLDQVTA